VIFGVQHACNTTVVPNRPQPTPPTPAGLSINGISR